MANEKFKKLIKDLDKQALENLLKEKNLELSRLVVDGRKFGYVPTHISKFKGNIEKIRKQIAIINTKIREKRS